MKKLIALAVAAATMVSAAFALDLEAGGRFFLGTNLGSSTLGEVGNDVTDESVKDALKKINLDSQLDYGFGAYVNFALFGGLGVQGEANLTKGTATINGLATGQTASDYEVWTLDLPVMLWANFDLWRFTIGGGVGVNFSMDLQPGSLKELYAESLANAKDNAFRMGLAVGLDAKFYFTKHLGLVASGRYIMDFNKKEVPLNVNGVDTGAKYPTLEFTRRSLYGGLALEFKFF
jgi:hypothetical protein